MATSGSVYSSYAVDSRFRLYWERTEVDIPNNRSKIKWTLYLISDDYWYSNAVRINSVYINGTLVKGSQTWSNFVHGTYTLASDSIWISHQADGTKSFSVSLSGWFYSNHDVSGSGNFTLDTIPRYANPVPSLTARTETSLTIDWTADGVCDQVQFSSDNGSTWSAVETVNANSGSYTFTGLTVNTTYQVKVKARRKDSQLTDESSAVSMSTYNYPYASTMPDFDIGASVNIGITNPLGHTVTVELLASNNNVAFTGTTSTQTISATPTVSTLYASIPNAMSGSYKVRVTYGASVLTEDGGLYNVVGSLPTAGNLTYADSNNTAVAITQDDQKIVQNISIPNYSISVQGTNSATIASVSVTVNGNTFNLVVGGSTATGTGGVINSASNVQAVATITDSRGQSITKTVEVEMIAWNNPSAIININRQQNFYSETDCNVDASYTQIGASVITINLVGDAVPITGKTTPSQVTATLTDNVTSVVQFDNEFEWNITIVLTDSFGGSTTYHTHIDRGIPAVFTDRRMKAFSVNGFPSHDNSIEVWGGDYYKDGHPIGDEFVKQTDLPLSVPNGGTGSTGVENITSEITLTRSSGNSTVNLDYAYKFGKVVIVQVTVTRNGTVNAGDDMLVGTWTGHRPVSQINSATFNGSTIQILTIDASGTVTVRQFISTYQYTASTFGFVYVEA